jgi:hypothetical protein
MLPIKSDVITTTNRGLASVIKHVVVGYQCADRVSGSASLFTLAGVTCSGEKITLCSGPLPLSEEVHTSCVFRCLSVPVVAVYWEIYLTKQINELDSVALSLGPSAEVIPSSEITEGEYGYAGYGDDTYGEAA